MKFLAGEALVLQRYMVRRLPKALSAAVSSAAGARVTTRAAVMRVAGARRAKDRRLGCALPRGVEVVPLYTVNSAEALRTLATQMKQMWVDYVGEAAG